MQWFKHDVGAFKSEQIQALRVSAGGAAVDVYYALVEEIYENEGPLTLAENQVKTRSVLHGLCLGWVGFLKMLESIAECDLLVVDYTTDEHGKQLVTVASRRATRELDEIDKRAETARQNGKKGGRPKKKNPDKTQQKPRANPDITQKKPDYKTIKTIEKEVPKGTSKKKNAAFEKPSVEQVAAYAAERGASGFDARYFHDHYESNGWMVGKSHMKDWKATVRNWIARDSRSGPKTYEEVGNERFSEYNR